MNRTKNMYRIVHQIKAIRQFANIQSISSVSRYNPINHQFRFYSITKSTKELLDDTEELDPELIESCLV